MDVKVYTKEEALQPSGNGFVLYPNIIDIIPETEGQDIINAQVLTDTAEILEQECALATIWQKWLDPLDKQDGVRWGEAILGEINAVQLMDDITNAVSSITNSVKVVFDSVVDPNTGKEYLKYTLQSWG